MDFGKGFCDLIHNCVSRVFLFVITVPQLVSRTPAKSLQVGIGDWLSAMTLPIYVISGQHARVLSQGTFSFSSTPSLHLLDISLLSLYIHLDTPRTNSLISPSGHMGRVLRPVCFVA